MLTAADTADLPLATHLQDAPEMAALHLLHTTLDVAYQALHAVHHDLRGPNPPTPSSCRALAKSMLPLLDALGPMLFAYRVAKCQQLYMPIEDDDDIPF